MFRKRRNGLLDKGQAKLEMFSDRLPACLEFQLREELSVEHFYRKILMVSIYKANVTMLRLKFC